MFELRITSNSWDELMSQMAALARNNSVAAGTEVVAAGTEVVAAGTEAPKKRTKLTPAKMAKNQAEAAIEAGTEVVEAGTEVVEAGTEAAMESFEITYSDLDLQQACSKVAKHNPAVAPKIKAIIANYVPQGMTPLSGNIAQEKREKFIAAINFLVAKEEKF